MSSGSDKITSNAVGNLTPGSENNLPLEHETTLSADLLRLPNLYTLLEAAQNQTSDDATIGVISLQTLEMLEAELHNQAILPPIYDNSSTLSQHVAHEINIWKWRARRRAINVQDISFTIDLGSYLAECALALLPYLEAKPSAEEQQTYPMLMTQPNNAWRLNLTSKPHVQAKLYYLESFAGYLLGRFEDTNDRYKKGLNLILRSIAVRTNEEFTASNTITLPTSIVDFFHSLQHASN